MQQQKGSPQDLLGALRSAEDYFEPYHWLRVSESESVFLCDPANLATPNYIAAQERIQKLSDEQVLQTYEAVMLQLGDHSHAFEDATVWRNDLLVRLGEFTQWCATNYWYGDFPGHTDPRRQLVEISLQGQPFAWDPQQSQLHQILLPLAMAGVLHTLGYAVSGTNMPDYQTIQFAGQDQEPFWPPNGLLPVHWTSEDAVVYAAEQTP